MSLPRERIQALLDQCSGCRLAVVGDLMLDRYIYGDVDRISPEAPVPVVSVKRETAMPGGASNVARNIRALNGQADVLGLVGQDAAGRELLSHLEADGVVTDRVVTMEHQSTTLKTRIIAERQQVVRVDWDPDRVPPSEAIGALQTQVKALLPEVSGVILEDYGKGVVQQQVVHTVLRAAAEARVPVGYDPKDTHLLSVEGITVATPNRKEAFHAAGLTDHPVPGNPLEDAVLLEAGQRLLTMWKPSFLLVTLGAQGMLLMEQGEQPVHVPTRAREVFDVSGAGDTVIATCMLALAAGASPREAAELANLAAGLVVAKLGTATCTPAELLEFAE